jgi:hypothetical protein
MVCTQDSKAVLDVYLDVAIGVNSNLTLDWRSSSGRRTEAQKPISVRKSWGQEKTILTVRQGTQEAVKHVTNDVTRMQKHVCRCVGPELGSVPGAAK